MENPQRIPRRAAAPGGAAAARPGVGPCRPRLSVLGFAFYRLTHRRRAVDRENKIITIKNETKESSPPRIVAGGDTRRRAGLVAGVKVQQGRTRGRTERTCSGSGSCGLLSGVLLPPATPRTGEPAEVSAWPGAGAVGNPSSVSDRLFSWSISLGERGAMLARLTGAHVQPLPLAQPRARPPARSGSPGQARGRSSGGGTRRYWDVTPLGPGENAVPGRAGPGPPAPAGSCPRVAALPLEARAAQV